jgi:elongation factor Tu
MTVEDVFSIRGRGTVVTGRVEQGSLQEGDVVELRGHHDPREVVIEAIEVFRRRVKVAETGAYVGLQLKDVTKDEVLRGDVLSGSKWDFSEAIG